MTPVSHKFTLYGKRLSAIGILTFRGIEDVYIAEGNVNSDVFHEFLYNGAYFLYYFHLMVATIPVL